MSTTLKLVLVCSLLSATWAAKGGGRKGRGKAKNLLPFANVVVHSLTVDSEGDSLGSPKIEKASHWTQMFKLGNKLWLICVASGWPRPRIKWFKDATDLVLRPSVHVYEEQLNDNQTWSKVEIDPTTMGDQGVYSCFADNERGARVKNIKTEYYY